MHFHIRSNESISTDARQQKIEQQKAEIQRLEQQKLEDERRIQQLKQRTEELTLRVKRAYFVFYFFTPSFTTSF
jgi:cell division protein FtsB